MYLEDAIRGTALEPIERLPNARLLGETSLMFQCDPTLSAGEMAEIGHIAVEVIGNWEGRRVAA